MSSRSGSSLDRDIDQQSVNSLTGRFGDGDVMLLGDRPPRPTWMRAGARLRARLAHTVADLPQVLQSGKRFTANHDPMAGQVGKLEAESFKRLSAALVALLRAPHALNASRVAYAASQ